MICQHCKSTVDTADKFCPKCGGVLKQPGSDVRGLGVPATPPVVDAVAYSGGRIESTRATIPESGTKYRGLKTSAELLIRTAAVLRILFYVFAGLGMVSMLMCFRDQGAIGLLWAILVGAGLAVFGSMIWLFVVIHGELMYVIIDVEENLRRKV